MYDGPFILVVADVELSGYLGDVLCFIYNILLFALSMVNFRDTVHHVPPRD